MLYDSPLWNQSLTICHIPYISIRLVMWKFGGFAIRRLINYTGLSIFDQLF